MQTQSRLNHSLPGPRWAPRPCRAYLYRFVGLLLCTSLKPVPSDLQPAIWAWMLNLTNPILWVLCFQEPRPFKLLFSRVQCYCVLPAVS